MKKSLLGVILTICLVFTFITVTANADDSENYCGDAVTWKIDAAGTLTVSGIGDMYDFVRLNVAAGSPSSAPWGALSSSVSKVVIDNGVTNIGMNAFAGFTKLTSVQIGDDVSVISPSAFEDCLHLRTVSFGGCVKTIGEWAFGNCESIASLSLNEGLRSIGSYAFSHCTSLTSVTLPTTLNDIGIFAFSDCEALTSISIPDEISSIADGLFCNCSALVVVNLPAALESIGERAFYNCDSMSIFSIPSQLKSIGSYAFYHCGRLANAVIPERITVLGDWVFGHCTSLKTLVIPSGVTEIAECAFYGCSAINDVRYGGTLAAWDALSIGWGNTSLNAGTFHTKDRETILAHDVCGENVVYILDGNGTLTISGTGPMEEYDSVKEGDDLVTNAPWSRFRSSIKKVVIESGVTNVSRCAFYACESITSVTLPDSVTTIGDYAFRGCSKLSTVRLGSGLKEIGVSAFYACKELSDISLPSGLTGLGESAFCYCSKLEQISIPNGVTSVPQWTFYYCEKLRTVKLGSGITSIGNSAFAYCSELGSITIPDSVTEIKEWAFGYCSELSDVAIGIRVKTIASYAFCGCASITDVDYNGSKYQWEAINVGTYNENLLYAVIHVNKLDAPTVTAGNNAESGKPLLRWTKVNGANKYEIWRATSSSGTYTKLYTTSSTSYTNTSASVGVKYYYKVKALSSTGSMSESVFSSVVSASGLCAAPKVTVSNDAETGKIVLKWEAVTGAKEYEVWRATSSTGTYTKMITTTKTSYTNTGAVAGNKYYYKVKAVASAGSGYNSVFGSSVSRICDCAKPTVSISLSSGHPKLSWSAVDGASKYQVYCCTSKNGTYYLLGTTSNKTYTNSSAKSGTIYYYKVVAVSSKTTEANSASSTIVSIKAK